MKFISLPCPECGRRSEVELDDVAYLVWMNGRHVQDAFPEMSLEQRELLITGTHPECWEKIFPPEEEEFEE